MRNRGVSTLVLAWFLGIGSLLLGSQVHSQSTVFVSNSCGSDTNAGTLAAPLDSVATALALPTVSTIRVLPNELGVPYPRVTVDRSVDIIAEFGPLATRCEGFVIDPNVSCQITGFTVSYSGGVGIDVLGVTTTVNVATDQVLLSNLVICNSFSHGVQVRRSSGHPEVTFYAIRNCTIWSNGGSGIFLLGYDPPGGSINGFHAQGTATNCIIGGNGSYGVSANITNSGSGTISLDYLACSNNTPGCVQPGNSHILTQNLEQMVQAPCFLDPGTCDFRMDPSCASGLTLFHTGHPCDLNPDGTRNNLGAFGGPGSVPFFDCGAPGPRVVSVIVDPCSDPDQVTVTVVGRN